MRRTSSKTILVVEDDPDSRDVMEMAIAMEGYTVRVAQNQAEAAEIMALDEPGVVLLDYYGVGDNTRAFIANVRARYASVPIVLMTGARNPKEKTRELGLKEYLAKPFQIEHLKALLRKHRIEPAAEPQQELSFSLF